MVEAAAAAASAAARDPFAGLVGWSATDSRRGELMMLEEIAFDWI